MNDPRDRVLEKDVYKLAESPKFFDRDLPFCGFHGQVKAAQLAIEDSVMDERERCAVLATKLAEDAATRYAGGYSVNFGREVGDAIRAVKP